MIKQLKQSEKDLSKPAKDRKVSALSSSAGFFFKAHKMKTLAIMAIPLSQGLFALVDGEDYEELSKYKWCAAKIRNTYYAARAQNKKTILMHRQIINAQDGQEIDHFNNCGLDNRKYNMRFCTHIQNCQNQLPHKNASSKYKGVSWHKRDKKWQVRIEQKHIGLFDDEIDAAKAYDVKAKELFGEFACLNFGDGRGWNE